MAAQMLERRVEQKTHVVVSDCVVRAAAFAAHTDDSVSAQETQRMRNRGLGDAGVVHEIGHAALGSLPQREQQPKAPRIREHREHVGHEHHVIAGPVIVDSVA